MRFVSVLLLFVAMGFSSGAGAHDASQTAKPAKAVSAEERAFGREGDPKKVSRTIAIDMNDRMRYSPAALQVKAGETIRFEVANSGQVMHEMVLGTMGELKEHAEHMRQHAGMVHDEANMVHVAPGKTQTLVWQFTKPGEFYYACLVPGHLEAGMIGKVVVSAAK